MPQHIERTINLPLYVIVRDSDYPITLLHKGSISLYICFRSELVYSTIQLYHQPKLGAAEINYIWADRILSSELPAVYLSVTQAFPDCLLCRRALLP